MVTRQIREAIDIVDLIGSYVTLRRAGASFKGLCPFHQEKTPSFHVSPSKQLFKCYGCNAGGDVFTFVQMREKVDFVEARRILADRAGIAIELERSGSAGGISKSDLVKANQWAAGLFRRNYLAAVGENARQYVVNRGISPEMVEAFGLGLAVDSYDALLRQARTAKLDLKVLAAAGLLKERQGGGYYDTFRHRLMFPIADPAGRIIGFGGRTLGDDPAKYLNTPATAVFDKSTNLFGLDKARRRLGEIGRAIVVEGYTDCIMAHQHGFTETVATLGTAMTDSHAGILRRYADKVVLLFDSDEAGQRAADRGLAVSLSGGLDVVLARVPEGKDPCDYLLSAGQLSFESVLKAAIPALEFKWKLVVEAFEGSATGPGRRRAIEAFLSQLSAWVDRGVVDSIQLGLLVNQVSKILALPAEHIHRQLQGLAKRSTMKDSGHAPPAISGQRSTPPQVDVEQEALRQILEVLINDPSRFAEVANCFRPAQFQDPALAAVAKEVVLLSQAGSDWRVDELIGRFQLPAYAQLITDLQTRGERRGGYDAVIAGAMQTLEWAAQARRTLESSAAVAAAEARSERVPDEQLVEINQALLKGPHFASPRARRNFLGS